MKSKNKHKITQKVKKMVVAASVLLESCYLSHMPQSKCEETEVKACQAYVEEISRDRNTITINVISGDQEITKEVEIKEDTVYVRVNGGVVEIIITDGGIGRTRCISEDYIEMDGYQIRISGVSPETTFEEPTVELEITDREGEKTYFRVRKGETINVGPYNVELIDANPYSVLLSYGYMCEE